MMGPKISHSETKPALKIQFFSDLHLELTKTQIPIIPVKGDILVLGGDMGDLSVTNPKTTKNPKLYIFMKQVSQNFKDIIVITGNREYYQWDKKGQLSMEQIDIEMAKFYSQFPNVHFLNKTSWTHPCGITFLGCTLWSNVPKVYKKFAESHIFTYKFAYLAENVPVTTEYTNKINHEQIEWLKNAVKPLKNCVVITHHAPSLNFFFGWKDAALQKALASDLDDFINNSPQIKLWICGHVHEIKEEMIGKTLVSMNCIGYPGDQAKVYFDKTISINY